jgi:hypothetical protein
LEYIGWGKKNVSWGTASLSFLRGSREREAVLRRREGGFVRPGFCGVFVDEQPPCISEFRCSQLE